MGEMDLVKKVDDLQGVSNYLMARKGLRWSALGSIIFGAIAVYLGVTGLEEHWLNGSLVVLGAFLFIEGVWLVAAPRPGGLILDGFALLAVGCWNIFITVMAGALGGEAEGRFVGLGVVQIVWGIQSLVRYRRLMSKAIAKPSEEILKKVDELVGAVTSADIKKDKDVIQFQTKGFTREEAWKARLAGEVGIFVAIIGDEALFVRRGEANIASKGKVLLGKSLKASFQIGGRKFKGTIPPESMQRFEAWKASAGEKEENQG